MSKQQKRWLWFRIMILVSIINTLPVFLRSDSFNQQPIDVFLFVDKVRYLENIAYDVSELLTLVLLTFVIHNLLQYRIERRIALCFLIVSLLEIPWYFLWYSRYASIVLVPLLALSVTYVYYKERKRNENKR